MIAASERETHLSTMRDYLQAVRSHAEFLGYGYEIVDAINDLIDFVEYDIDEIKTNSTDEFDILNDDQPEIYCAKDWWESLDNGWFSGRDGTAYWGTESHYNYNHSGFGKKPEGASHVHWFSK